MTNEELIKRYPFLSVEGEIEYTLLDEMPIGWRKAFGEKMCEEIALILRKGNYLNDYVVLQIKEKYGELRWYSGGVPENIYDALHEVIEKYTKISRKTCIRCGAPATKISKGWISPWCNRCADEQSRINNVGYVDIREVELE